MMQDMKTINNTEEEYLSLNNDLQIKNNDWCNKNGLKIIKNLFKVGRTFRIKTFLSYNFIQQYIFKKKQLLSEFFTINSKLEC